MTIGGSWSQRTSPSLGAAGPHPSLCWSSECCSSGWVQLSDDGRRTDKDYWLSAVPWKTIMFFFTCQIFSTDRVCTLLCVLVWSSRSKMAAILQNINDGARTKGWNVSCSVKRFISSDVSSLFSTQMEPDVPAALSKRSVMDWERLTMQRSDLQVPALPSAGYWQTLCWMWHRRGIVRRPRPAARLSLTETCQLPDLK